VQYLDEVDATINLLAGIVEQAKLDATGKSLRSGGFTPINNTGRLKIPTTCQGTYEPHRAMVCAREFLASVEAKLLDYDHPTAGDVAHIVMEVIS